MCIYIYTYIYIYTVIHIYYISIRIAKEKSQAPFPDYDCRHLDGRRLLDWAAWRTELQTAQHLGDGRIYQVENIYE